MKRLLSLLVLILFIIVQIVPVATFASSENAVNDSVNFAFIQAARELINDNWDDSFFSTISLKTGDSKMFIDGEERDITPPVLEGENLMLPAIDIAKAVGDDVHIDKEDGQVTVVDEAEEKDVVFDTPAESNMQRSLSSSGSQMNDLTEVTVDNDGYMQGLLPDGTIVVRKPLADESQLEELLNIDIIRDGENVMITKPFQLKQVVLQTKDGVKLPVTYGASDFVTDNAGLYLLQYSTVIAAKNACDAFQSSENISYAVPNSIVKTSSLGWGTSKISADRFKAKLSSEGKLDKEITVAVVDTGVDVNHPFLQGRIRADIGYDFIGKDSTPEDVFGHGTHVSGTVVDCSSSNVKILPIKTFRDSDGGGDELTISLGIRYAADKGANVINMSFGGVHNDVNCLVKQAVDYAIGKGSVCVAAAGNGSGDTKHVCPANIDSVITVAATDARDCLTSFTNYGDAIDVSAPGAYINSCSPGGGYISKSGTSMAAPHVSASVAMLLTDNRSLTPAEAQTAIRNIAVDCGPVGWDRIYGAGIIDFRLYFGDNIPPQSLSFSNNELKIDLLYPAVSLMKHKIDYKINPLNATNKGIIYTSSNENVAKYEDGGIVATGVGTAIITAQTYNGIPSTNSFEVVVEKANYWKLSASESFAGGSGTETDPYLIGTPEQLAKLIVDTQNDGRTGMWPDDNAVMPYYKLINDIDLEGKEWTPIQGSEMLNPSLFIIHSFLGHFDGNNHAIKNMTVSKPEWFEFSALFGALRNNKVSNLAVINANVMGRYASILAWEAANVNISNCYTSGKSTGIMNCDGAASSGFIDNIKPLDHSTIKNCFTNAKSISNAFIRIVNENVTITNCYTKGTFAGNGSFIGKVDSGSVSKIINTFSATAGADSFIKTNDGGIVDHCYYAPGNGLPLETADNDGAVSKNINFFKDKSTYLDESNWSPDYKWDFDHVWDMNPMINDGLPYLKSLPLSDLMNFNIEISNNTLSNQGNSIQGDLGINVINNTQYVKNAVVMVALYSEGNQLISLLGVNNVNLSVGNNNFNYNQINVALPLLQQSNSLPRQAVVKIFVWNGCNSMDPLSFSVVNTCS